MLPILSHANLFTSTHSYTCSHRHTPTPPRVIRALQQMKHRPGSRLKAQKKKKGETEVRSTQYDAGHWECVRRVLLLLKDGICCPGMPRGSFHITHNTHITTTYTPRTHHTTHTQTRARARNTHSHPSLLGEVPRRAGGACEERVALYCREPNPGMGRGVAGESQ